MNLTSELPDFLTRAVVKFDKRVMSGEQTEKNKMFRDCLGDNIKDLVNYQNELKQIGSNILSLTTITRTVYLEDVLT